MALAERLIQAPHLMAELTPPFGLVTHDRAEDRVQVLTDALGVGRLFEAQTPFGWVWSNRPAAAALFSDPHPTASPRGWQYAAGCEWFMDDSSPYEGVTALDAATVVTCSPGSGRSVRRTNALTRLLARGPGDRADPLGEQSVDATVESLQRVARSTAR